MVADGRFVVVGLVVGTLVGFTGMGAGAVTTPLLILFGLPPVKAIGSDLVYSAVTKTVGGASHLGSATSTGAWRCGWPSARCPRRCSACSPSPGSRPRWAQTRRALVQELLGGMLILAGLVVVARLVFVGSAPRRGTRQDGPVEMTRRRKTMASRSAPSAASASG